MFKVSKPEMVNKTFRMPAELVERLNVVAQTQKVSLNNLVCQCCEYALDNLSEPKEDKEQRLGHDNSDIAAILFCGIKVFKGENTLYRLNNLLTVQVFIYRKTKG